MRGRSRAVAASALAMLAAGAVAGCGGSPDGAIGMAMANQASHGRTGEPRWTGQLRGLDDLGDRAGRLGRSLCAAGSVLRRGMATHTERVMATRTERRVLCDHADLITPAAFGLVQSSIRGSEKLGKLSTAAAVPPGTEGGDADRDAEPYRFGISIVADGNGHTPDVGSDAFRDAVGVQCLGLRQQQGELLANEPRDQVVLPEWDREGASDGAERTVPGQVAERVVDRLEVID